MSQRGGTGLGIYYDILEVGDPDERLVREAYDISDCYAEELRIQITRLIGPWEIIQHMDPENEGYYEYLVGSYTYN